MKKNRPSSTAMFVANGMYYNIHQQHLAQDIPEDLKKYNTELVEHFYGIKSNLSKHWRVFIGGVLQTGLVKGFFLHFLVRKKCIDKKVRTCIEQGFEQVVVLGAGYDTLCSRLADIYPKVNFIEVDHPATSQNKISIFRELNWEKANIKYLAHDLKNIENVFNSTEIDKSKKTAFVCEGVLMYLDQKDVEAMLASIVRHFKNECKFIFTFMNESSPGDYLFKNATTFVRILLKLKNEPFTWGIKAEKIGNFLQHNGWHLQEMLDHKDLKLNFLSGSNRELPVAIGENIAVSTKA